MEITLWTNQTVKVTLIGLVAVVIDCFFKNGEEERETSPNKLESVMSSTPLQIDFWPQARFPLEEGFMQSENKTVIYEQIMINSSVSPHNFF